MYSILISSSLWTCSLSPTIQVQKFVPPLKPSYPIQIASMWWKRGRGMQTFALSCNSSFVRHVHVMYDMHECWIWIFTAFVWFYIVRVCRCSQCYGELRVKGQHSAWIHRKLNINLQTVLQSRKISKKWGRKHRNLDTCCKIWRWISDGSKLLPCEQWCHQEFYQVAGYLRLNFGHMSCNGFF